MTLDPIVLALIAAGAAFTGAVSQRVTGIGLALIAAPAFVLTLGTLRGMTMVIVCGSIGAGVAALLSARQIDWRMFGLIIVPAAIVSPAGAWTVTLVDPLVIQFVLALLIVAALLLPLVVRPARLRHPDRRAALLTGGVLGFVNSAAGVGGPALVAYAAASDWDFGRFRATAQPIFLAAGIASLASRWLVGAVELGTMDPLTVVLLVAATVVGVLLGGALVGRLPARAARSASVILAVAGAVAVAADAVLRLAAQ